MSADRPSKNALFLLMLGLSIQVGIKSGLSKEPPCPSSANGDYARYADHVVEIDSDGKLTGEANVEELFDKIAKQRRRRVILYVHGGRVTLERTRETTRCLTAAIQDSDPDAYPIFLNWEAGQGTSYFRHVAYERNGVSYRESSSAAFAAIASPLVFISDIGRGAFRLPINTLLSVGNLLQNCDAFVGRHDHFFPVKGKFDEQLLIFRKPRTDREKEKLLSKIYNTGFTYPVTSHDSIPVSVSMGRDSHQGRVGYALVYAATLPLQFGTEPVLDTFGTPAWNNMVRRTRSMFHLQSNYITASSHRSKPQSEEGTARVFKKGGAAHFFNALDKFMRGSSSNGFTLEIYAHSMGTMITNEAFAEHPDLRVDRLVYMAAACSIRDFQDSAGQFIKNHHTPFYNLSLHPRAELDEVEVSGIPVRGSLLVWIDEFFNQSQSFADRTLGAFENVIIARDLLPRGTNVHLKAFSMEDDAKSYKGLYAGPQKHNDFAKYYFWKPEFYNTDKVDCYYSRIPAAQGTKRQRRDLGWQVECRNN